MREFVTLWGLCVRHLIEQPRRYRAIENEVSLEQLHFLDRLPALDRGGAGRWSRLIVISFPMFSIMIPFPMSSILSMQIMRIRPKRIGLVDHWPPVIVILPVMVWLCTIPFVGTLIVRTGLIWLLIVCVRVRLRIEGVVAAMALWLWMDIVVILVIVRAVMNVLYRILPRCQLCLIFPVSNHSHSVVTVVCLLAFLARDLVPLESPEALGSSHTGLQAGSFVAGALERVIGQFFVGSLLESSVRRSQASLPSALISMIYLMRANAKQIAMPTQKRL